MSDMEDLGGLRAFEEGVRMSLHEKADQITPSHRLGAILDAEAPARRRSGYWLAGVAAMFVLVAALGVGYLLGNNGTRTAATSGAAAPAQKDNAGTKTGVVPSSAAAPQTPTVAAASWAMPVYYVVTGTSTSPWLLTRTFASVPDPGDRTARVQAAVSALLAGGAGSASGVYGLQKPWVAGTTATVTTTDTTLGIVLSQAGVSGLTADQQRVAVQSLVWTATAAAQLNVGVRVEVASGQPVFATKPAGTYSRPATSFTDLVPIWVDSPTPGSSVSSPVTVTGQACVFEASFQWQLLRGTTVVDSGNTSATIGCPTQGSYSISLGNRPAGTYTIRVYDLSMKDGSVFYETRVTFTVS
ncbi:MAG TPA: Gmad2 immunoglobulin-like domain-containing protein [Propionibacteriaceae bacterium]|nr:Gmad2 immunoglobulin-like domain-containing protein [Propionibacteriaceae bacterium]